MLRINNISKEFDGKKVVQNVTLSVETGERIAVLGPSGCGKSTLLNCISGILVPEEGDIFWNGEDLVDVPAHERNFGLMFQEYALFPHMNVEENICFGLKMLGMKKENQRKRLDYLLELVGLEGFEKRQVQELSGGEQQRVALARSLAPKPRLLLLDEPLGALDRTLRENLLIELQTILKNQTVILVTHDQEEAFQIADRVYIMNHGEIIQFGKPIELLENPNSEFVAHFLGYENIFTGKITSGLDGIIKTEIGKLKLNDIPKNMNGKNISVLLKAHHLTLKTPLDNNQDLFLGKGEISSIDFHGKMMRLKISINNSFVYVEEPLSLADVAVGDLVSIWMMDRKAVVVFDGYNKSN